MTDDAGRFGNRSPSRLREPDTTETIVQPFSYQGPDSLAEVVERLLEAESLPLRSDPELIAGIEEGILRWDRFTELPFISTDDGIEWDEDGGARIGVEAGIRQLAEDGEIRSRLGVLAEACRSVGSETIRHMGTIGGNLRQLPLCWSARRGAACVNDGGDGCRARDGDNPYHAILGGGPCWVVHPSDIVVALVALDATIEIVGSASSRAVPVHDFFVTPKDRLTWEMVLGAAEMVTAIRIPPVATGGEQRYRKVMHADGWDLALVSLAAVKRRNGDVKLVLGGVAPYPWRVDSSVEEDTSSGNLDETDIATLADRALYDAEPLAKNQYKVEIAGALLRDAIAELAR